MLTMKCKYALKALVVLASSEEQLASKSIAKKAKVPEKFLEAILTELKKNGAITSTRGAFGGHRLAKPPNKIMVGQVIRAIDGMLAPITCASTFYYKKCKDCQHENVCVIRTAMLQVRNKIADVMDNMSIQDLVEMSPRQRQKIFW
jgi:Rrf2 family protein